MKKEKKCKKSLGERVWNRQISKNKKDIKSMKKLYRELGEEGRKDIHEMFDDIKRSIH